MHIFRALLLVMFVASLLLAMRLGPAHSQPKDPKPTDPKTLAIAMSKGLMEIIEKDYQSNRTPALVAVSRRLILCSTLFTLLSDNPQNTSSQSQELKYFGDAYAAASITIYPHGGEAWKKEAAGAIDGLKEIRNDEKKFFDVFRNCQDLSRPRAANAAISELLPP